MSDRKQNEVKMLTKYVNPFVGTTPYTPDEEKMGNGNTFPGATMPFGMVQNGPATCQFGMNQNTYLWSGEKITGFVSTIISGTGGS